MDDYLDKYDLNQDNRSWLVNYFEEIGWFDPLPSMSFMTNVYEPQDDENDCNFHVYPPSRMTEEMPRPIYIPKKELMFIMMRSCIDIRKPEDLWVNKFTERIDYES